MRVLIINKFLYPNGGSETYIFKLGEALEQHGHEVQYFGMEHEGRCVGNRINAYRGGLCSFVFIFSAFILIVKSSIGKTPWNRVCMALLFGMVIVMITEILSAQNSYHFILSLCYFINTVWNDKEKTISV